MPTEFQKAMDRTLGLTDFSFCFLDDILIATAGSLEEHNVKVDETLKKIDLEGFSLKLSKCEFSVKEIEWLGFDIDREGVRPKRSKIQDIMNLKPPKTLRKLRSFIGSVNHLGNFIGGAQKLVAEFKESLSKGNKLKFYWSENKTRHSMNYLIKYLI